MNERTDRCPRCRCLTKFGQSTMTGVWRCLRCGQPAPPELSREEIAEALARVRDRNK